MVSLIDRRLLRPCDRQVLRAEPIGVPAHPLERAILEFFREARESAGILRRVAVAEVVRPELERLKLVPRAPRGLRGA
jgi:hypothetical protein